MLHTAHLRCHPSSPCPAVGALHVSAGALADGGLQLRFQLAAALNALCIPAPDEHAGFADNLWQRTCFEAFISSADEPTYREFNFSPSGQWAAYAFADYRQRDSAWHASAAPYIQRQDTEDGLALDVTLPASLLPENKTAVPITLHIGLSAVIESSDGALSYWALTHPGERPDFHQRASFTLRLPLQIEQP